MANTRTKSAKTSKSAKSAKKKAPPDGTKGAFIRKHLGEGRTAGEIVELGKLAGIDIQRSFVYNLKSEGKANGASAAKQPILAQRPSQPPPRLFTTPERTPASQAATPEVRALVRSIVLRVGLDQAEAAFNEVFAELRRELEALV